MLELFRGSVGRRVLTVVATERPTATCARPNRVRASVADRAPARALTGRGVDDGRRGTRCGGVRCRRGCWPRALVGAGDLPAADVIVTRDRHPAGHLGRRLCAGRVVRRRRDTGGGARGLEGVGGRCDRCRGRRITSAATGSGPPCSGRASMPSATSSGRSEIARGGWPGSPAVAIPDVAVSAITATTATGRTASTCRRRWPAPCGAMTSSSTWSARAHRATSDGSPTAPGRRRPPRRGRLDRPPTQTRKRSRCRARRDIGSTSDGRGGERGVGERTTGDGARRDRCGRASVDASRRNRRGHEGVRTRRDRGGRRGGSRRIGENYAQELAGKREVIERLGPHVHFIGHLQTNKVRQIAPLVDVWETVDRHVDRRRGRPAVPGGAGADPGELDRRGVEVRLPARGGRRAGRSCDGRPASTSPG